MTSSFGSFAFSFGSFALHAWLSSLNISFSDLSCVFFLHSVPNKLVVLCPRSLHCSPDPFATWPIFLPDLHLKLFSTIFIMCSCNATSISSNAVTPTSHFVIKYTATLSGSIEIKMVIIWSLFSIILISCSCRDSSNNRMSVFHICNFFSTSSAFFCHFRVHDPHPVVHN